MRPGKFPAEPIEHRTVTPRDVFVWTFVWSLAIHAALVFCLKFVNSLTHCPDWLNWFTRDVVQALLLPSILIFNQSTRGNFWLICLGALIVSLAIGLIAATIHLQFQRTLSGK